MSTRRRYLPSRGLMDTLERGENAISRIDSTLSRSQQAADRAKSISSTPASKFLIAIGIVAAVGVGAYVISKNP